MMQTKCAFFTVLMGLLVLGEVALPSPAGDMGTLKKALEAEIQASGAEVGLAFKDLETGQTLSIREREMMHAASTMKIAVMIEVFRQAEKGRFRLEDRLPVKNQFRSIVDGSPFSLKKEDDSDFEIYGLIDTEMSIRNLVERMITVSSNLAANILIDLVQAKNVTATLRELGIRRMEVLRGVEDSLAFKKGFNNRTDAHDLMMALEAIATRRAASSASCREMVDILTRQKFRSAIPAGVPEGVLVGSKDGWITGIEHDAAIVFPPGRKPYLLVVLTRGMKTGEEGEKLIARLSKLVYHEVSGK